MTEPDTREKAGSNIVETLVRDPLTEVTRKERVYLLAVSLIGITIVKTGLVPSKIATFGIELEQPDRQALLVLLAIVTFYFLVAFIVYAASDLVTRGEIIRLIRERIRAEHASEENQNDQPPAAIEQGAIASSASGTSEFIERRVKQRTNAQSNENLKRYTALLLSSALLGLAIPTPSIGDLLRTEGADEFQVSWGSRAVAVVRVLFEFLVPVLVGIFAIYTLLSGSSNLLGPL